MWDSFGPDLEGRSWFDKIEKNLNKILSSFYFYFIHQIYHLRKDCKAFLRPDSTDKGMRLGYGENGKIWYFTIYWYGKNLNKSLGYVWYEGIQMVELGKSMRFKSILFIKIHHPKRGLNFLNLFTKYITFFFEDQIYHLKKDCKNMVFF